MDRVYREVIAGKNILSAQLYFKLQISFLQQLCELVYILLEERRAVKLRAAKSDMWTLFIGIACYTSSSGHLVWKM